MQRLSIPELGVILLVFALYVLPLWRIATRMGYPGALGLLSAVPGLNILLAYFVAFTEWPVLRELETLRREGRR